MNDKWEERPRTKVHPPLMLFLAVIAGFCMRAAYGGFLPVPRIAGEFLGTIFVVSATVIFQMGVRTFAENAEELRPATPSRQLFTDGIYAYSRNPLYVAMILLGSGLGFATLNLWTVLATFLAGVLIHFLVILPEEAYLDERFGQEYEAYKKSVRRWV